MSPLFAVDLACGAIAIVGGVWLRRRMARRPAFDLDDRVVALDMASALRTWGTAVLILGVLAVSGLPGGFDLPLWSVLALGVGATATTIVLIRWRWEGWALREDDPAPDRAMVESETGQYGLLAAVGTTLVAYFVGLAIGSMQPVHAVAAVLEGTAGYALGLAIATPQSKIRAGPLEAADTIPARPAQRRPIRRR